MRSTQLGAQVSIAVMIIEIGLTSKRSEDRNANHNYGCEGMNERMYIKNDSIRQLRVAW
jgi:hypothetical protein